MKLIKAVAITTLCVIALSVTFVAGVRFGNAHNAASIRSEAAANASRLVGILRHVDAGGESCHSALQRELDNALIRTGYVTGQPDLSPLSRAYLREAAAYRKDHPYEVAHPYSAYVKHVLELVQQKP